MNLKQITSVAKMLVIIENVLTSWMMSIAGPNGTRKHALSWSLDTSKTWNTMKAEGIIQPNGEVYLTLYFQMIKKTYTVWSCNLMIKIHQ